MDKIVKYAGFLRGINVGGRHKLPMPELRKNLTELACVNVKTLLNSGNVVFESDQANIQVLEYNLESNEHLIKSIPHRLFSYLAHLKIKSN